MIPPTLMPRPTVGYVLAYVVFPAALLLLLPTSQFERMNIGWPFALVVVLPFSFVSGFFAAWSYYGRHDSQSIPPFYIHSCRTVIGSAVTWLACLLLRPIAADLASTYFFFGLGPVISFYVYRRTSRPQA